METLVSGPESYDLFQAIGLAHGVDNIRVLGDYGLIEGSLADDKIIAGYAKHKSWAAETNRFFGNYLRDPPDRHLHRYWCQLGTDDDTDCRNRGR